MISFIKNSHFGMGPEEIGADIPITAVENLVTSVYASINEAMTCELDRLYREDGVVPTCILGCCHCCRYHILMNAAEAHTLAQYVKREFSAEQIDDLRLRTQQWHEWDNSRPGRHPVAETVQQTDLSDYTPCCPLLVDGACIAYPVRPVVCRTHLVSSHPLLCRAATDPKETADTPVVLTSIIAAASPFSATIKDHIEEAGLDFSRSLMLLPHWLAIEMGWEFALAM